MRLGSSSSPLALAVALAAAAFLPHPPAAQAELFSLDVNACMDQPCGACQGDCDADSDCEGSLACFLRAAGDTGEVPGCGSGGLGGWDYCYDPNPPPPTPAPVAAPVRPPPPAPAPSPAFNSWDAPAPSTTATLVSVDPGGCGGQGRLCDECEGDCDADEECSGELVCYRRVGNGAVPGCSGSGTPDWDYCGKAPPGALPPCDLSVPPQRRPKCVLPRCNPTVQKHLQPECSGPAYKPPCNPAMPQWAQPPCISGPTASPTPRPTRSPTPGVPTIFRPPTVLPPCDPTIPPWERPPCRIVLPPCDPSVPPSAQLPCTVPEPTSAPTASPTASLLWSTSTDGCGTDGCMECEGDCDSDAECASGLVCIQRTGFEFVRGCGSGGKSGWDYCAKELQLPLCDELPPNTPCVDRSENCRMWASGGECDGNPQFMAENCALTCNRCEPGFGQPDPSCVDLDQRCAAFASSGECQRSAPFMNENCPRTCNTCPPAPRPPCLSRSPTMRPTTSPTEQLPLCDTTIPPWERPRCVEPLPPCNIALQLWEQPPCTPAWSPPLRPGQIPVIPSLASQRSGGGGRDIGDSDDE